MTNAFVVGCIIGCIVGYIIGCIDVWWMIKRALRSKDSINE